MPYPFRYSRANYPTKGVLLWSSFWTPLYASSLPDADLLVKELHNFRTKVSLNTSDPLTAWREGQHDDLVLALGLAVWAGERVLAGEAEQRQCQCQESRRVVPEIDDRPGGNDGKLQSSNRWSLGETREECCC